MAIVSRRGYGFPRKFKYLSKSRDLATSPISYTYTYTPGVPTTPTAHRFLFVDGKRRNEDLKGGIASTVSVKLTINVIL